MADLCAQQASRWPADQQSTSYGVCMAESGGNPNAWCHDCVPGVTEDSRGLYQINIDANTAYAGQNLFDPDTNGTAALAVWHSQGWGAWSTFTSGRYLAFVPQFPGPVAGPSPISGPVPRSVGLLLIAAAAAWLLTN